MADPISHEAQQAGQQRSDGLEASVELALGQRWQLSANASLVRAKFDDFDELVDGVPQSRAGNRPANVPRRTANLWLSKCFGQQVEAGIGARYVDERYADTANSQSASAYTGWQLLPDVRLGLQINNLFDRAYAASVFSGEQWVMGTPRSYFATVDYTS